MWMINRCVTCVVGKIKKLSFALFVTTCTFPLELIEVDLWGPTSVASNGNLYYMSIVDMYSRYTSIYFLHWKSDVKTFIEFHVFTQKQLGGSLFSMMVG